MTARSGTALLPLHYGRVPPWLASRMASLGRVIAEAIVHHYGRDELLRRLAHPYWFQSLGAVMGMDWHSSGITTSVLGALKRGLAPVERELGLYVCGGRGAQSRKTPNELVRVGELTGLDGVKLADESRLVAKVDGCAVQDGYDLYLHGFIVTAEGHWTVVQQGMNGSRKEARRYHWLSEAVTSFVEAPHAAIDGVPSATSIVNLTDARAARSRAAQLALVADGPDRVLEELARLRPESPSPTLLLPHLQMPEHHDVRRDDVVLRRLAGSLAAASDRGPKDFAELLLTPGVGPRTVLALSMVAEVVHGAPSRFSDPARYSLAHGGKDGHPYPVPLKVYDETVRVLKRAVEHAKLGNDAKLSAIRRLDEQARRLERLAEMPDFEEFVEDEWDASPGYEGTTAVGPAKKLLPARRKARPRADRRQLALPRVGS
jgi:hypothetical protein